jgi:acetylornithine/succinyldiaminopimelate/putrescine aminotransferase
MTLAKALGGGLPIGAMCATARIAGALTPGTHGSTFGGNPVTAAAGTAALRALADPALLNHVRAVGLHFRTRLESLAEKRGIIRQVRGVGLMLGAELDRPGAPVVERCLANGLLINCTADRVLRFLPPLVITRDQVDEAFAILQRVLGR